MDAPVVEFVGKELGQHGSNVYFKEFSVTVNGVKRGYKLGEFYFMRKDPQQPICIAEFQLIWANLKDGRKLAAAKLYFRPEDTKSGRLCDHGEDELMEADRFVTVYCEQVPAWEYNCRIPFGTCVYDGVRAADQYISQHKEETSSIDCCCKAADVMVMRTPVIVLSFPAYCRYRASMKLLATGCRLPKNLMLARGAVEVDCSKTKILFNRFKFQHPNIESFSLAEDIRIPQFKGRPRKRKQSRTKATNDTKKTRVEKENSIPESRNILQLSPNEDLKSGCNQTYRIVAPPGDRNRDRNVIHVKIESQNGTGQLKGAKGEVDFNRVDDLSNDFESTSMENEGTSYDEDDDYKLAMFGDTKYFPNEIGGKDETAEARKTRSLKREDSDEAPPSELVKNGKTGTILDEAFFREMKNGLKAAEGVDKEKMTKILVDACKDQENFKRDLFVYMKQRGTPIVYVPKVGYTRVDLPKLFSLVVSNGGYTQVTLNHKWKKVYDEMALATTITSAATCMRRHYEKLLLPFEKHLRIKHKQDALANKTYSISSQASQPLVLTIKKVKKESPVSPSDNADADHSPNSGMCRHVDQGKELIDKSETCHANSNETTPLTVPQVLADESSQNSRSLDVLGALGTRLQDGHNGQYHTPLKTEPGCGDIDKRISCPDGSIPTSSLDSYYDINSVSTTVCAIPLYKVSEHTALRKNMHATSITAAILPKQSSHVIPIVGAMAGANTHVIASSQVASSATAYHRLHGKEVTVITKAKPVENFNPPLSSSPAVQNIQRQSQGQPVFKKRRGRPPKHVKAPVQLVASSMPQPDTGHFDQGVGRNSAIVHNFTQHASGHVPHSLHAQDTSMFNSTKTAPATVVRGTRMSAAETERRAARKAPVKMYEYVMMSDSMNNKLVKHKQGVISFPNFTEQKEAKVNDVPPDYLNSSLYMRTLDYGELRHLSGIARDNHPRVESVMSFSSKGCVPSTLMYEGHHARCAAPRASDNFAERAEMSHEETEAGSQPARDEQDEVQFDEIPNGAEARSVIVGPPPLIPISKDSKRDRKGNSKPTERGDVAVITRVPGGRAATPIKSTSQQISLMSDMKALKESFDKTIDQSLEDLRRVTENDSNREGSHANAQREKKEFYTVDSERKTERHGLMNDPLFKARYFTGSSHGELKVLTDRIDGRHEDFYINANHQVVPRDAERGQEYGHEMDSSDRLLRVASRDSFSCPMPHEPANTHHSSALKRDQANFSGEAERGHRPRPPSAYERAILESYEQRGVKMSKFSDDLMHSKYRETMYAHEKGIAAIEHATADCSDQSRSTKHLHGSREQTRPHAEAHHQFDSRHYLPHHHEHAAHPYFHDRHHLDLHQNHRIDHNQNDHRRNGHKIDHRADHHHSEHHNDHQCSNRHRSDHPRGDHGRNERHHNGHPYPVAVSPASEDMSALRYSLRHSDHRPARQHIASFQDAAHLDFSHHPLFSGRNGSPAMERSPPVSSMHHSWYSHHMAVVGKDGTKAMYWHQQVHH